MTTFVLRTDRFVLTPPEPRDVEAIHRICSDPAIQKWTTVPSPYLREHAEQWVAAHSGDSWDPRSPIFLVRESENDEPLGCVELRNTGSEAPSLGFWADPERRGEGIVPEATDAVLTYAFDTLGVPVVRWECEIHDGEPNWQSIRVVWKLGFHIEGVARAAIVNKGVYRDSVIGSLARDEPRTPREAWRGPDTRHPAFPSPSDPEALVRQFHRTYALPIIEKEPNADRERTPMRLGLVAEEFGELVAATYGEDAGKIIDDAFEAAHSVDDHTRDTVEVADALGDLVYVAYGMALELGIPMADVLAEIQASNLSKLDDDGKPIYREDGKVLKGHHYFPPDLKRVLGL